MKLIHITTYHKTHKSHIRIKFQTETNTAMAIDQQVKLLGLIPSPFVTRAELALKLKGIQYEYILESHPNKSDLLLKSNPVHKQVPVLLHNDNPVCESLVIVEYVDEAFTGYPIFPSDPYHRAQARFWSKFIDDKVVAAVFKAAWNPSEKEREKGGEEAREALKILNNELKVNGKFFNGDSIGFLDIASLFIFFWVPIIQEASEFDAYNGEKYPNLEKWGNEILNDPVVKEVLPPKDVLFSYFRARFQRIIASK